MNSSSFNVDKTFALLCVDVDDISFGKNVSVHVSSNVYHGNVTVCVGNKEVNVILDATGKATAVFSDLAAGNYSVVVFLVDDNYVAVNNTYFSVNRVNSTINISDVRFVYGGSGIAGVTFTDAGGICNAYIVENGMLAVVDGDRVIVSGLDAGSYTLSVSTIVDYNHASVTGFSHVIVDKISTRIISNENEVMVGNNVSLNTVNIADGSIVSIKVNDKTYVGCVKNNSAFFLIDEIASAGTFDAVVNFDGDNNHMTFNSSFNLKLFTLDSFTALEKLINESNGTVVLDYNYTFNPKY